MLTSILEVARKRGAFSVSADGGGIPTSMESLWTSIAQTAGHLRTVGIEPGQAVLFCGDQGVAAFVAFWATVSVGAIFVPVSTELPRFALNRVCALVKPRLVMLGTDAVDATIRSVLVDCPIMSLRADGCIANARPDAAWRPVEVAPGAPGAYILTSGSTSEPKAVILSHGALMASARLVAQEFGWRQGERLLNLPDPHTMSGLRNAFIAAPLIGMHWICAPVSRRHDLFAMVSLIGTVRPHRIVAAPLLLRQFNLLGARVDPAVLNNTRALYTTGADLNVSEAARFHSKFGVPVINYYGLTETAGLCLTQRLAAWAPGDATLGHPVGCDIRITDVEGRKVPSGVEGELWVRQPCRMTGYLGDPAGTEALFSGDWLRTGDMARQTPEGRIVLVGRRANFIKTTFTERINPLEIEAVLEQMEDIADAAVCGVPDIAGGERIAAALVLRDSSTSLDDATIARAVAERLGVSRAPTLIRRVDAIPRSGNGKIKRSQLPELFHG